MPLGMVATFGERKARRILTARTKLLESRPYFLGPRQGGGHDRDGPLGGSEGKLL
jgi:hypothetical protein